MFQAFGTAVHRMCIVLHSGFQGFRQLLGRGQCTNPTKSLSIICLCCDVIRVTGILIFGAANASLNATKEAAYSSNMTYTLFESARHIPKCRSGWRNGNLHRLS